MIDYLNPSAARYKKALFFDRDGTIIVDTVMPYREEDLHFFPDTFEALREAGSLEASIIIITNQSGIALGRYRKEDMTSFHRLMLKRLHREGIRVDAILYCPHYDTKHFPPGYTGCTCSKPMPGLLKEAAGLLGFLPENSVLIGDKHTDIGAGIAAGCRANILVTTGIYKNGSYEKEELALRFPPSHVTANLREAVGVAGKLLSEER